MNSFFKKILLTKKLTLKIDSAASTGSSGEYVGFLWPPAEPAHDPNSLHEQNIAADFILKCVIPVVLVQ